MAPLSRLRGSMESTAFFRDGGQEDRGLKLQRFFILACASGDEWGSSPGPDCECGVHSRIFDLHTSNGACFW